MVSSYPTVRSVNRDVCVKDTAQGVACAQRLVGQIILEDTMGADDGQAGSFLAVQGLLMISVPRARRLKTVECLDSSICSSYLLTCVFLSVCV